jgi:hypothetical protein
MAELVTGTGDLIWRASRLRSAPSCRRDYPNLGRVGKKNLKIFLGHLKVHLRATVCGILASGVAGGCATDLGEHLQSGRVLAWYGLQGRWIGPVVPTGRACGPATHGLMSIGERGFGLDPFQSTAVIRGKVGDDGRLSGSLIRQDSDHKDHSIVFEGIAAGSDAISGTLQSGRCSWTVTLHRG